MKIALIGYGKMGHAIEAIAQDRGHEIVLRISSSSREDFSPEKLRQAAVAIEFTRPEAALENVRQCLLAGLPVVCGTTGWNDAMPQAKAVAEASGAGFLYASNFSIGVNIFFEINELLARLMGRQEGYEASIQEVHHLQKKDKPSGTAISLAEQIIRASNHFKKWTLAGDAPENNMLPIDSIREDAVPGTHKVSWSSKEDTIEIIHTAHSRAGFALGAVLAAEFLDGKQGIFSMKDVLGIGGL